MTLLEIHDTILIHSQTINALIKNRGKTVRGREVVPMPIPDGRSDG